MHASSISRLLVHGAVLLACAACSDSQDPDTDGRGTTILLTDSPFPYDLVSRVDLFIKDVRVGADSGTTGSPCSESVIVLTPNRTFDLLTLQQGATATLGEADLAAGEYRAVCLTIDTDQSSITLRDGRTLTGSSSPGIQWGTAGERILKAELLTPIVVGDTDRRIVIHFDVGASFAPLPLDGPPDVESGFAFLAVLGAVDPDETGSIAGRVVGGSGGEPMADASLQLFVGNPADPPGTWAVIATGTTDEGGAFRLAYLAPSSRWANLSWVHILVVNPPTGAPFDSARVNQIEVVAGRETAIGDVTVQPKQDLRDNRIAYVVDGTDVVSVREDGSNPAPLTDYPSGEYERTEIAAWSPDGSELLGKRIEVTPLDEKIVLISGDGGARPVAYGFGAWGIYPGSWSPDGGRIAYVKAHASHATQLRIHTVAPDGSGDAVLATGIEPQEASDFAPAWSPDGSEIAFLSNSSQYQFEGFATAAIVSVEGSEPRQLVQEEVYGVAWDPDGSRVAVLTEVLDFPFGGILLVTHDGTGSTRLSPPDPVDDLPVWSPDGTRLAFVSIRDGNEELYVMSADGGDVRRLTDHPGLDRAPAWSPDGTRLAFETDRDGNWEIYTIGVGGTGLTNLTRSPSQETQPKWR